MVSAIPFRTLTAILLLVLPAGAMLPGCSKEEEEDTPPVTEYWRGEVDIDLDVGTVGDNWTEQAQLSVKADIYTLFFLSSVGTPPLCDAEGSITSLTATTTTITPSNYFTNGQCRANNGPKGLFSVVFSAGGDSLAMETIGGTDLFHFRLERFQPTGNTPIAP
jgi:hypothetical protein